jgi:hypothetical protein
VKTTLTSEDDRIRAPWPQKTVDALNAFQDRGLLHPFTCGGNRCDDAHKAYAAEHGGDYGQLVATPNGWKCPVCDYRQDWAHEVKIGNQTPGDG